MGFVVVDFLFPFAAAADAEEDFSGVGAGSFSLWSFSSFVGAGNQEQDPII